MYTPSTLRRYVTLFGDYLSQTAKWQRRRRFTPQDMATLSQIKQLASSGVKLEDIGPQLAQVIPEQQQDEVLETELALPGLLDQYNQVLEFLQAQADQIVDQADQLRDQADQLRELKAQLDAQAAELQRLQEWQNLPWWKKFSRRQKT
jgi:DNA-binding transcriptional MerR regulator